MNIRRSVVFCGHRTDFMVEHGSCRNESQERFTTVTRRHTSNAPRSQALTLENKKRCDKSLRFPDGGANHNRIGQLQKGLSTRYKNMKNPSRNCMSQPVLNCRLINIVIN